MSRKFEVGDIVVVTGMPGIHNSTAPIGTLAVVKTSDFDTANSNTSYCVIVIEAYKPFKDGWGCNGFATKGRGQIVDSTIIRLASVADILGAKL